MKRGYLHGGTAPIDQSRKVEQQSRGRTRSKGANAEEEMKKIAKKQEHKKDGEDGTVVAGGRSREERKKEEEGMELVGGPGVWWIASGKGKGVN